MCNHTPHMMNPEPGTHHQSLFRLQNKFRKIPLPVIYLLDQVSWCNLKQFFVLFQKLHLLIYASQIICPFEPGMCGKEGEKLQKSQEWKEFFRLNRKHFS